MDDNPVKMHHRVIIIVCAYVNIIKFYQQQCHLFFLESGDAEDWLRTEGTSSSDSA